MATPSNAQYEAVVTAAQAVIDANGPFINSDIRYDLRTVLDAITAAKAA